jgi:hypothetical protein
VSRRSITAAAAVTSVAVAAGVALALTGHATPARAGVSGTSGAASLATVTVGPLSSQINQSGTLGYAAQADGSAYAIIGQQSGTYTRLPQAGQVVRCGGVLYRVSAQPVVLLCGATPLYRALAEGDSGTDVAELNRNLVALGYATTAEIDPSADEYGAATADAVARLQDALNVDETGALSLGTAVMLPGPLRVAHVAATLGMAGAPGAPIAQATSTARQVQTALDASEQASVHGGDHAAITLPDGQTTTGRVTRIGKVASAGQNGSTIPVDIGLDHPRTAGELDAAPVQVQITVAGVARALIAPVNALLALAGGGYALETVDSRGVHRLVPVRTGLFDDADGLVAVTGDGIRAGMRIVVPST